MTRKAVHHGAGDVSAGRGSAFTKDYVVEASSRFTIGAHADDPRLANQSFSTKFETLNGEGMIVERAMWWPATLPWIEAHNSAGVTTTGTEWAVAQGQLAGADACETYVLVANTSATTANLRVRAMAEDDTVIERFFTVPADARFNIRMMDAFPEMLHKRFGVVVTSLGSTPAQITAEVSVYSNSNGVPFNAGSNAQATRIK